MSALWGDELMLKGLALLFAMALVIRSADAALRAVFVHKTAQTEGEWKIAHLNRPLGWILVGVCFLFTGAFAVAPFLPSVYSGITARGLAALICAVLGFALFTAVSIRSLLIEEIRWTADEFRKTSLTGRTERFEWSNYTLVDPQDPSPYLRAKLGRTISLNPYYWDGMSEFIDDAKKFTRPESSEKSAS